MNPHNNIFKIATISFCSMVGSAYAEMTTVKQALDAALKNPSIEGKGYKLYSMTAKLKAKSPYFSISFFGNNLIHTVYIGKNGKERYSSRDKGSLRVFDDLDFSKLPAPTDVFVPDLVKKATEAMSKLEMDPNGEGNVTVIYNIRSEFRQKDVPYHAWTVSIPMGKSKNGKRIEFKNGKLNTINNTIIY